MYKELFPHANPKSHQKPSKPIKKTKKRLLLSLSLSEFTPKFPKMSRTLTLPNLFLSPEPASLLSPRTPSSPTSVRLPSPTTTVKAFTATETPTRRRTSNNGNSLYEVLRVKRNASQTEIKTAYRTLAKLYHPDASCSSESESENDGLDFIAIHNAYATLSDPASRASYDLSLGPRYSPSSSSSSYSSYSPYSSSSSSGLGFCSTRRWETDQCW